MSNATTTRILFQRSHGAHASAAKPWLWPLPRLDGELPCVVSPADHAHTDRLAELGYRERISSSELVPVFAPMDGAITYATRTPDGGTLSLDHPGGWSTTYSGLDTVLASSRDRCSGRRKPRVRGGDVLGYLRGTLRLGFELTRWQDGEWTAVDPSCWLDTWTVQAWFTERSSQATAALAI